MFVKCRGLCGECRAPNKEIKVPVIWFWERQCACGEESNANRSFNFWSQTPMHSVDMQSPRPTHEEVVCVFWFLGWTQWRLFLNICFKDWQYACVSPSLAWGAPKGQVTTCTAFAEKPLISKALIVFSHIWKRPVNKWEEEGVKLMMAEILTSCFKSVFKRKMRRKFGQLEGNNDF